MNPIDIVKATIAAIETHDIETAAGYASPDLTVTDPNLPRPVGKDVFFGQMKVMLAAFPDWHYDVHAISALGDQVTVSLTAIATHTAPLQMGAMTLPPTGKQISVPDKFIFTVKDNLITVLQVDSPPGGGAPSMMRQLGLG